MRESINPADLFGIGGRESIWTQSPKIIILDQNGKTIRSLSQIGSSLSVDKCVIVLYESNRSLLQQLLMAKWEIIGGLEWIFIQWGWQ